MKKCFVKRVFIYKGSLRILKERQSYYYIFSCDDLEGKDAENGKNKTGIYGCKLIFCR